MRRSRRRLRGPARHGRVALRRSAPGSRARSAFDAATWQRSTWLRPAPAPQGRLRARRGDRAPAAADRAGARPRPAAPARCGAGPPGSRFAFQRDQRGVGLLPPVRGRVGDRGPQRGPVAQLQEREKLDGDAGDHADRRRQEGAVHHAHGRGAGHEDRPVRGLRRVHLAGRQRLPATVDDHDLAGRGVGQRARHRKARGVDGLRQQRARVAVVACRRRRRRIG